MTIFKVFLRKNVYSGKQQQSGKGEKGFEKE